jgi:hypothetical protein
MSKKIFTAGDGEKYELMSDFRDRDGTKGYIIMPLTPEAEKKLYEICFSEDVPGATNLLTSTHAFHHLSEPTAIAISEAIKETIKYITDTENDKGQFIGNKTDEARKAFMKDRG